MRIVNFNKKKKCFINKMITTQNNTLILISVKDSSERYICYIIFIPISRNDTFNLILVNYYYYLHILVL